MSEWDDPVAAQPVQWRGMQFDSKLELSWAVTLEHYGFDWWDHPGSIALRAGGAWEPDFRVGDVLCEVKPWAGESVDRTWKPYAAHDENQLPVLILRPGVVPPDWDTEEAGCDWQSCDGEEWVVILEPGAARFEPLRNAEKYLPLGYVRFAASRCMVDTEVTGLAMRHWSEVKSGRHDPQV